MHFVCGPTETLHIEFAMFCIISQPWAKYILRAFRVTEFFGPKTKLQNSKTWTRKVVFAFLVLVDAILLSLTLQKRTS